MLKGQRDGRTRWGVLKGHPPPVLGANVGVMVNRPTRVAQWPPARSAERSLRLREQLDRTRADARRLTPTALDQRLADRCRRAGRK
jgi:hypothetical protein